MKRFEHERLVRIRTDLNLTQEAVADAVGVDVRTYRRYETGAVNDVDGCIVVRNASRRQLIARLCSELGVEEDELLVEIPERSEGTAQLLTQMQDNQAPDDAGKQSVHTAQAGDGQDSDTDTAANVTGRYYVYISDSKIAMLLGQSSSGKASEVSRFTDLDRVLAALQSQGNISTSDGGPYIRFTASMRWTLLPNPETPRFVFFGGHVDGQTVLLVGSSMHVIGVGGDGDGRQSCLGSSWLALDELLRLYPELEHAARNPPSRYERTQFDNPKIICQLIDALRGPAHLVESVAKVLFRTEQDGLRAVVASPLYVSIQ
jgi:transcriptional regulator with XRE-family HTH domain